MLLVSTTRATNQIAEMLVLIYTTQWADRFTCCKKPEKTDSFIGKQFRLLAKVKNQITMTGKCSRREFLSFGWDFDLGAQYR